MSLVAELAHRYDLATSAAYSEVALSGLGKNIAQASGSQPGAILFGKFILDLQRQSDGSEITIYSPGRFGGRTWSAYEVALTGLAKNIALTSPGDLGLNCWPGWYSRRLYARLDYYPFFLASADPRAEVIVGDITGTFTASADPRVTARPGPLIFEATADPRVTADGYIKYGYFEATAEPTVGSVGEDGLYHDGVGSSTTAGALTGTFTGTADPRVEAFVRLGQMAPCITGPETPPATIPPNYVY